MTANAFMVCFTALIRRRLRTWIAPKALGKVIGKAHYNNARLNSAVGYITPKDMLAGRQQEIHAEHFRKFEAARKQRQIRRHQAA